MTIVLSTGKTSPIQSGWAAIQRFPRWLTAPIVLSEWTIEPRWHIALKQVRMLLVLLVYSLAWYWFGAYATANTPASPAPGSSLPLALAQGAVPQPDASTPVAAAAESSGTNPQALQAQDAAGLKIDTFRIGAVSGYPNRLRYELALSNKGRKLVGKLQFVVLGEQDGALREMPLDQPAALSEAKPNVEVSRLLNTRGYLDLPEGYVVHKVVVQVVEGSNTRVAQSAPMWPT